MSMAYGMGYGLFGSTYGWGGSMVMIETDARLAVSYVTNQMREPEGANRDSRSSWSRAAGPRACRLR